MNGVRFDGCRLTNGNMLEAKGPGYEWAMISDTEWREKYKGVRDARDQMRGQSEAAPDRIIEWHFAEERVAKYFRDYAARFSNVRVFYTPPETK